MVTFTAPQEMRTHFRRNQQALYSLFFKATSQALTEAAQEKLGVQIGMIGILHTWTRQLAYHPHIHYLVPMGGITTKGKWKRTKYDNHFLSVKLLSIKTRIILQQLVRKHHPKLYLKIPTNIWYKNWNSDIQLVGKGATAVNYLARYVTQSAMSSKRIIASDQETVTISYTPSGTKEKKPLTLTGNEFLRRYLQHVLPNRFKRIRYYGWLSPAAKKRFEAIKKLLHWDPILTTFEHPLAKPPLCPCCNGELHLETMWFGNKSPPRGIFHATALYD
jgi:hypothetical protein